MPNSKVLMSQCVQLSLQGRKRKLISPHIRACPTCDKEGRLESWPMPRMEKGHAVIKETKHLVLII